MAAAKLRPGQRKTGCVPYCCDTSLYQLPMPHLFCACLQIQTKVVR